MTFSGDHLEERSNWSKTRSRITISAIIVVLLFLTINPSTQGPTLVGIALMATIMFHEAGHFIAAKWSKMKATEFFVGFGPRIWSFKRGETEYGIKAIPLGGYVKILGMTDMEESLGDEEHRSYREGKTHKKLIVILAGVTVNIFLAFILIYSVLVFRGIEVESKNQNAIIGKTSPGLPAAGAGLRSGDQILEVGGEGVKTFDDLVEKIGSYQVGDKVQIKYLRDGKTKSTSLTTQRRPDPKTGKPTNKPYIGIVPMVDYEKSGPVEAVGQTFTALYNTVDISIGSMTSRFSASGLNEYSGIVANGEYERQDRPSSVAGIVNLGGQAVDQDIWDLLRLMAVINIFLALFNLLPILPLDGGHAAIAVYEWVASKIMKRRIKANHKKLIPIATAFIGFVLLLSLSTLWLDILQIAS